MSNFGNDEARSYMHQLLKVMHQQGGSDLFISSDFPPSMKHQGAMKPLSQQKLTGEITRKLALSLMNDKQRQEFDTELECNFAISLPNVCRFRVNVFVQQQQVGMVIRTIAAEIPNFEKLQLPEVLKDVIMTKRGLVLVVGGTGSGKSTTLAAMIDHRNASSSGHIITVEDPVEYVHKNKSCLITHREVGVDTLSWHHALKNTLRQAPDVILIGEIRDTETMEHAIAFAETGHLCLGTLHANNANQTIDRIINFFPEERRSQLLGDLSSNLRAIVSQRLVRTEDGKGRRAAIEILLNTPTIAEQILKGQFHAIKETMAKSRELGMRTFDQALFDLYNAGHIGYDEAIRNADSANELRLQIKLRANRGKPGEASEFNLAIDEEEEKEGAAEEKK
ncbi:PilT/PilU family type 4a pilus ATPase [Noviherbaspirillum malthae]|uniref:PilT/PilU family type 4a pilus ATPase n=1 Tax=Noviherbaspirillum malthae TaxID=1260987 RepID=UPI002B267FEE|nr:PilT/PilU family type 4a pilus ATPase [Noviherbaspirillum malthae]